MCTNQDSNNVIFKNKDATVYDNLYIVMRLSDVCRGDGITPGIDETKIAASWIAGGRLLLAAPPCFITLRKPPGMNESIGN